MKKYLAISILVLGCTTTRSHEASKVIVTNHQSLVSSCDIVGNVSGDSQWGGALAQGVGYDNAETQLREEAVNLGANYVLLSRGNTGFSGARLSGIAYRCNQAH